MIFKVFILSISIFIGLMFFFAGELRFLAPYRDLIIRDYGLYVGFYLLAFYINIYSLVFFIYRKFFLKETGAKISVLEKQLALKNIETDFEEWRK